MIEVNLALVVFIFIVGTPILVGFLWILWEAWKMTFHILFGGEDE